MPINLEFGGSVIVPSVSLKTLETTFWDPTLTLVSDVVPEFFEIAENDALSRSTDGASIVPFISVVTDTLHHADMLPGYDTINGGAGDDLIFGDDVLISSLLETDFNELDEAIRDASAEIHAVIDHLYHLSLDFDLAEHTIAGYVDQPHATGVIEIGNDVIYAGDGDDVVVSDGGRILAPMAAGFPVSDDDLTASALSFHTLLRDIEYVAVDFSFLINEAHVAVLSSLVAEASTTRGGIDLDHHDLLLNNDVVTGGQGADLLIGDYATIVTPLITSLDTVPTVTVDSDLIDDTKDALHDQKDYRKDLRDDHVDDDHSDFNNLFPANNQIDLIAFVFEFDIIAGNDDIAGGDGDDMIIGDTGIVVLPAYFEDADTREERQDVDKAIGDLLSELAKGHDLYLNNDDNGRAHLEDDHHHEGSADGADVGNDYLRGDDGNDTVFGDHATVVPLFEENVAYDATRFEMNRLKYHRHGHDHHPYSVSPVQQWWSGPH